MRAKEQMLQWVQSGSLAGPLMDARNAGVEAYLAWVQRQRAQGAALIAGSVSGVTDNTLRAWLPAFTAVSDCPNVRDVRGGQGYRSAGREDR